MEPIPAASAPATGPKMIPHKRTSPSPKWMYPKVGVGNLMIMVATQVNAANSAEITSFFVSFIVLYAGNPALLSVVIL